RQGSAGSSSVARSQDHHGNVEQSERLATAATVDPEGRTYRSAGKSTGRLLMHFLNTIGLSREQLDQLLESALRFKRGDDRPQPLAGKSVALVFFNPSLRTRASMQVGIYELGGNPVVLEPGGTSWTLEHREGVVMNADKTEHVAEFVRVLERYCVAIGVRTFA